MITVKSRIRHKSVVKFINMVPGKLYRFLYDSGATVLGIAGRNSDNETILIVLKVVRGVDDCADEVGDVWDTTSTMHVKRDTEMELADDVEITIVNNLKA